MEAVIARSQIIRKLDNISDLISNTPLIRIENLETNEEVKIYAKAEWLQFGGTTKIRAAYSIIRHAVLSGELDENRCLIDASTGKMAIAYATVAARMNIPVKLYLPDLTDKVELNIISGLGAEIRLTKGVNDLESLRHFVLKDYNKNRDKYFFANHLLNENYWKAHYYTTAEEIIEQTNGEVTHFVSGIGDLGAFTGVAKRLKNYNKRLQVVSLYPDNSEKSSENWKLFESFKNIPFLDNQFIDYELPVSFTESQKLSKEIAKKEGLILSAVAASNILGALKVAGEINIGTIVTILPDSLY